MKFVHSRRKVNVGDTGGIITTSSNMKLLNHKTTVGDGLLSIKSLMTGKQQPVNTVQAEKRTRKILGNSATPKNKRSPKLTLSTKRNPFAQGPSIEFTERTDAISCTSVSTIGQDGASEESSCSFAPPCFTIDEEEGDDLSSLGNDPYLLYDANEPRCGRRNHQRQLAAPFSPEELRAKAHSSRQAVRSTSLTGGHFPSEQELGNGAVLSTAKLTSLGTFDFPDAAATSPSSSTGTAPTAINTVTPAGPAKSLGGGCFEVSASSSSVNNDETTGLGFSSPLTAIGRGLKILGSTLTLPRVLHFGQEEATHASLGQASDDDDYDLEMKRLFLQAGRECDYWGTVVTGLMKSHGKVHAKTAEGLLQLGYAYMLSREYAQAVIAFQSACRIWKQLQQSDDDRLALARVVDAIGMAWARVSQDDDQDHCYKAKAALEEAFKIRYDLLGPWHIDTVETLNKIAYVHLHLREYDEAGNAYWEVFWVRKAIFGGDHPSVAIAAHALGNVMVHLAATEDAAKYFQIAVEIFDKMALPNKHPAVTRLMKDYKRLDRIHLASRRSTNHPSNSTTQSLQVRLQHHR